MSLDPARLNKTLIIPVHRVSPLNNILHRVFDIKYLTITDVSAGYHNLKLENHIYLLFPVHFKGTDTYVCHLEQHQ